MKSFLKTFATLLIFYSLCFSQSASKIQTTKLTDNLYHLPIYGVGITALVGDEGVLLVDSGYREGCSILKDELINLGAGQVKFVVNTHWHFDHVTGNECFGDSAVIIAQKDCLKLLQEDQFLLGDTIKALPLNGLPQLLVSSKTTIYFNGEVIEIIPITGGHTGTDLIVYFKKNNVLHVGDLIFTDMFPFIDVSHGGSVITLAENLKKIIADFPENVKIIPGHGRILKIQDVKEYLEMIETTILLVNKASENSAATEILADWLEWGKAFSVDDWVGFIRKSSLSPNN